MNYDQLNVFVTAVEKGTLSAAAKKLDYTPSGVSRAIEALEHQVGFPLILRNRRGVRLTAEGEALLPIVKEIIRWSAVLEERTRELRGLETGTVVVGTTYAYLYPWIADVIAQFHELHPAITVEIVESSSSILCKRVEERSIDLALVNRRKGDFRWTTLGPDKLVYLLPLDHPYAQRSSAPDSLVETDVFVDIYPGRETDNSLLFTERGLRPHVGFSTHDHMAACAIVRAGLGITLVNEIYTREPLPGIAVVPLEPVYAMEFGIATPEDELLSPAARRFIDYAMTHIKELALYRISNGNI